MDPDIPRPQYSASDSFCFRTPMPSSPIEIPGRHKEPECTSERTTSPELVFEMEPLSPKDLSSTNYSLGLSTSRKNDEHERTLLYSFPVARHCDTNPPPLSPQSNACLTLTPIRHKPLAKSHPHSRRQGESASQSAATMDPSHSIRALPVYKISGLEPDFAAQAPGPRLPIEKAPQEQPLLPPPRSSSRPIPSLRPWILPGRPEASGDELLRSLEVDPNTGDFTQYLFRRIQKPLQPHTFQEMMSQLER
ncbi:hypothetical protein B0H14DRAFT_2730451 [Mycena olivaceomarginata]|nr:hypothetical protein B0H14DRAFT_2730451 [Mycena olivaceomarginata]